MISQFKIDEHVKPFLNADFIVFPEGAQSFSEFVTSALSVAENLQKAGVKKESIVILLSIPQNIFPIFLFALWKIEAVAFPVNPKFPKKLIRKIARESGAEFIISSENSTITHDYQNFLTTKAEHSNHDFKLNPENTATLIMTSGSTGKAKFAAHTIANHLYSAKGVNEFLQFSETSSWLLSLPVYHVGGLAIIVRCFLAGAALIIPVENENPEKYLLQNYPTHISLVSTQLFRFMEKKETLNAIKKCKAILLGGSAMPDSLLDRALSHKLKIYSSYGLTEMASTVAIGKIDQKKRLAKTLPFRELQIGKNSEILLKGECLFRGYLKKNEIVKKTDKYGWFYSGDLGRINTDGTLIVLGRKDNMFISGGENIYPEEIERLLLQIDGIERAIVVAKKNEEFGYRPVAFIKSEIKVNYQIVERRLREKLAAYKIPDKFLEWPKEISYENSKIKRQDFLKYIK